jgi:CNT family concentrative nucleoside transporter
MHKLISLLGLLVMLGIAWLLSTNRKRIPWRSTVLWGVILQMIFAILILKTAPGKLCFEYIGQGANKLIDWTNAGASFLFGELATSNQLGFKVAFQVLPTIIFISSLSSVLYHLGIIQVILKAMARVMSRLMKVSGAESLAAAANVFVGMTEAPLFIRPYIATMTTSELFCLMTSGMATIAGAVMVAYISILRSQVPDIAGHILSASVMSAPAALAIAKIMMPEVGKPKTSGRVKLEAKPAGVNVIDAAAIGASEGLKLALNVGAMLLAFIALIAMGNAFFGLFGTSMEQVLGWLFAPFALLMGVPWSDAVTVGNLLGQKTILNEFVAYLSLNDILITAPGSLHPRSVIIATYALCGFANFGSLAIILGGIGSIAPKRRGDLARLGIRAIIGGTLAGFMTASIAGMLL